MAGTYVEALAATLIERKGEPAVAKFLEDRSLEKKTKEALASLLMTDVAWQVAGAAVTEFTPSCWLVSVELEELKKRRAALSLAAVIDDSPGSQPRERAFASNLMGLAFSGGGIRSATFCLGVLQGLAELKLFRHFDYLSSVSGGGYIHQWLAAWIHRLSPTVDATTDRRCAGAVTTVTQALRPPPFSGHRDEAPEISWLRRYSNYLTPKSGLFSADTWVGMVTWLRNTLLNQAVVVTALFLVLAIPQALALAPRTIGYRHAAFFGVPAATVWVTTAATMLLILAASVGIVARGLMRSATDQGSARKSQLDEGDVQWMVVLPMLVWALLLTMAQSFIADALVPTLAVIGVAGSVAAATLAFCGGAVAAYREAHRKTWLGDLKMTAGILAVAILSGATAAAWAAFVPSWVIAHVPATMAVDQTRRVMLVLGPPFYLLAPMAGLIVLVGLLGRTFMNSRREWLARLAAWAGMYAAIWMVVSGASLFGHASVRWLFSQWQTAVASLTSWLGLTIGGVLAGKSADTQGTPAGAGAGAPSKWEPLATIGPYVFIAGLLLLDGWAVQESVDFMQRFGQWGALFLIVGLAMICGLFGWRVDINEFSMHAFYRDRLARCYLGASNNVASNKRERMPDPFTGFDPEDAAVPVADLKASRGYCGPLPIFCSAVNLTSGDELAWQERKAASFIFAPVCSGYDVPWVTSDRTLGHLRYSGYAETATFAYPKGVHVHTAAAISGAAVSPSSGYHTKPATAFLLTLFNVRLGWWLRNPRTVRQDGMALDGSRRPSASPHVALPRLLCELFGNIDDTSHYVYLTDGGHFDNMGLYELVRRRCRYIVVCDAEQDGGLEFDGIAMAIRKCRADFGVEVCLDLRMLRRVPDDSPNVHRHAVVGTVIYPEAPDVPGIVVYLKSSLTGDEPADVFSYHREHDTFPHDATLDQWFTESQFESYRRLGHHIALETFKAAENATTGRTPASDAFEADKYFTSLKDIWYPPTPQMEQHQDAHTARYDAIIRELRTEQRLTGLVELFFLASATHPGTRPEWRAKGDRAEVQKEYVLGFAAELFEFIWTVYDDLELVHEQNFEHPRAQGWVQIFRRWIGVDVILQAWLERYESSYSKEFQAFVKAHLLPDG